MQHINFSELLSLVFSLAAIILSSIIAIKGWWKHRNIYDVELHELFSDEGNKYKNLEVSRKLNSGDYTILHTEKTNPSERMDQTYMAPPMGPSYHILLGKIKK